MRRSLAVLATQAGKSCRLPVTSALAVASCRSFSSAFEPYYFLHSESVRKSQQDSFMRAFEANEENWKDKLTPEEIQDMKHHISQMKTMDNFNEKMTGLFGPKRHEFVRQTRTWKYIQECVDAYLSKEGNSAADLLFGEDSQFESGFKDEYVIDEARNQLLSGMHFADLRFAAAAMAIESVGGPQINAVFGCRERYHFKMPDPFSASAEWQSIVHNKMTVRHIVMLTSFYNVRLGKAPDTAFFTEMLESEETNAFSEPLWREVAVEIAKMPEDLFLDQLDRVFVKFQTDEGVTKLTPRFKRDMYYEPEYQKDVEKLYGGKGGHCVK